MARSDQLIRHLHLLQLLEDRRYGATLAELREALLERMGLARLSERTVRRDLAALQAAGYDVRNERRDHRTVWLLGPYGRKSHEVHITLTELLALSIGRDLLLPLAGTMFWEGIERFWQRVQEEVPESVRAHYLQYRRFLHVHGLPGKSYVEKKGMLETVQRCIRQHRVLQGRYRTVGAAEPRPRRLEPLGLVLHGGSIYVVAREHADGRGGPGPIKQWKLDRFDQVEAIDAWFSPPADFDLRDHLRHGLGVFGGHPAKRYRVRVRIDRAPWVLEDPWHPDQTIEHESETSAVITFPASHPMAVIPRVLALGDMAELLEPSEARRQIADILAAASRHYRR